MNKLVLKDGTEIENGTASKTMDDKQLMIRIPGNKLAEAAVMFSNPAKTETIVSYFSIYRYTYTGYTEMYSVQYFDNNDYIEVWLKGENTSFNKEITVLKEYAPWEDAPFVPDVNTTEEVEPNGSEESDTAGEN